MAWHLLWPIRWDSTRRASTGSSFAIVVATGSRSCTGTRTASGCTLQARNQFLEEQFRLAQLKRFAPSREKFGAQGCLFNEAEQDVATLAPDAEEEADKGPKSADNKRGRKPLPAHLPRQRVEHDLPESEKVCRCCQGALHRMGEEISEQLDIVPATVQVLQHVRFKYACRQCDRHGESSQIITSPMPPQPMPGSIASPATVATILTTKYADGLSMYRLHAVLLRGEVDRCTKPCGASCWPAR